MFQNWSESTTCRVLHGCKIWNDGRLGLFMETILRFKFRDRTNGYIGSSRLHPEYCAFGKVRTWSNLKKRNSNWKNKTVHTGDIFSIKFEIITRSILFFFITRLRIFMQNLKYRTYSYDSKKIEKLKLN